MTSLPSHPPSPLLSRSSLISQPTPLEADQCDATVQLIEQETSPRRSETGLPLWPADGLDRPRIVESLPSRSGWTRHRTVSEQRLARFARGIGGVALQRRLVRLQISIVHEH